jgi:hypothetical protein
VEKKIYSPLKHDRHSCRTVKERKASYGKKTTKKQATQKTQ